MSKTNPIKIDFSKTRVVQFAGDEDSFYLTVEGPKTKLGNLILFLMTSGAFVHLGDEEDSLFAHYGEVLVKATS